MKIKTATSYNLDLLCFMNVMTGDKFFTDFHKEAFEKFYPAISEKLKKRMSLIIKLWGDTAIGTAVTMPVSSISDFNNRDLVEMIKNKAELKMSMKNKVHASYTGITTLLLCRLIDRLTIPLAEELENAGFKEFWHTNRLPGLLEKCDEVNKYMEQFDATELIRRYISLDNPNSTIYLCSFAKPHGIKLCGNNFVSDYSYKSNDSILEIATHEVFHPPYDIKKVKREIKTLGKKPWVKKAYDIQKRQNGYSPMSGFIEENIVEALGIYIAIKIGADIDPKKYFIEHDNGSHVISPYFYDFLCENEKDTSQSFEDYFTSFVDSLSV